MNIYVGNLSRNASEEDLRQAFEAFGQVATTTVIKDKFTGESRGFGFVEMPSKEEALGRALNVNEARPREQRPRFGGGGGGGRGGPGGGGFSRGPRR